MKAKNYSTTVLTALVANLDGGYAWSLHFRTSDEAESTQFSTTVEPTVLGFVSTLAKVVPVLSNKFFDGLTVQINDKNLVAVLNAEKTMKDANVQSVVNSLIGEIAGSNVTVVTADGRNALVRSQKATLEAKFAPVVEETIEETVEEDAFDFDFGDDDYSLEEEVANESQTRVIIESVDAQTAEENVDYSYTPDIEDEYVPYISEEELAQMSGHYEEPTQEPEEEEEETGLFDIPVEEAEEKVVPPTMIPQPHIHIDKEIKGKSAFHANRPKVGNTPSSMLEASLVEGEFFHIEGRTVSKMEDNKLQIYLGYRQQTIGNTGKVVRGVYGYWRTNKGFKGSFSSRMTPVEFGDKNLNTIQRMYVQHVLIGLKKLNFSDERKANTVIEVLASEGRFNMKYDVAILGEPKSYNDHLFRLHAELSKWKADIEIENNMPVKKSPVQFCGHHRNDMATDCAMNRLEDVVELIQKQA